MGGKLPTQTYHDIADRKVDFEYLRNKLKLKQQAAKRKFSKKYPHVEKFLTEKGIELGKIREHSAKIIGAGALTGTLLLSSPTGVKNLPPPAEIVDKLRLGGDQPLAGKTKEGTFEVDTPQKALTDALTSYLPGGPRSLTREEEKNLEQIFEGIVGIKTRATLEGEHLNTTYGYIGAEQHLRRYPGDTVVNHKPFLKEGIAPGLGAWGYFASSKTELTPQLEEVERWYAVTQTLYLPEWGKRQPYLRDWYKYRKVLIVNTDNGNAVIASIADAGPAAWTGKHFGGSPEVMEYLGGPRYKKGPVVMFFVDDPENKVPLGPVEYNRVNLPEVALRNI